MITTRAVPVPLSHHHRRVTQIPAALTNDFADPSDLLAASRSRHMAGMVQVLTAGCLSGKLCSVRWRDSFRVSRATWTRCAVLT